MVIKILQLGFEVVPLWGAKRRQVRKPRDLTSELSLGTILSASILPPTEISGDSENFGRGLGTAERSEAKNVS